MENKNKFWRGVTVGVLVTAFACLVTVGASVGLYMFGSRLIDTQAQSGSVPGELNLEKMNGKLTEIGNLVDQYYLFDDRIDGEQSEAGVYQGYLFGLNDPYAAYYTPEDFKNSMDEIEGTYCGIGAMVSQDIRTGVTTIVRVFEDSPAEKAGLLPGDILQKVDGFEAAGTDLSLLISEHVKGEEGTDVVLTVFREGEEDSIDLTVTRAPVDVQTVSGMMLDDGIGLISVIQFDVITEAQFKEKVDELEAAGMERLIVDLRNNPGGELNAVIGMADYILEDGGTLLTVRDKDGKENVYKAEDGHSLDIPMAVLVNGHSASASEVFTGAMKDYDAAVIVGTTTFGKGIVQSLFNLSDGSAVKLTTAHYFTPDGHNIHEKGIEPDVEEELSEEAAKLPVIPPELDNQLQAAIRAVKER